MLRSSFRRFLTFTAAAMLLVLGLFAPISAVAVRVYREISVAVKTFTLRVLEQFSAAVVQRPLVLLVKMRSHALAFVKREAPWLTGSWRMCPST